MSESWLRKVPHRLAMQANPSKSGKTSQGFITIFFLCENVTKAVSGNNQCFCEIGQYGWRVEHLSRFLSSTTYPLGCLDPTESQERRCLELNFGSVFQWWLAEILMSIVSSQSHKSSWTRHSPRLQYFAPLYQWILQSSLSVLELNHFAIWRKTYESLSVKMHSLYLLAPQSGALKISAYRDFHPIPSIHPTYSFRAFKPFYGDQKQCK